MRLLFLIGRFPEVSETFIWREAQSFLAAGDAQIVSLQGNSFTPDLYPADLARMVEATSYRCLDLAEVTRVGCEALRNPIAVFRLLLLLKSYYPLIRCLSRLYSTLRVRSIIRESGVDVVHAHWRGPTDVAYLLNRLDGTAYTVFLHAHDIYDEGLGEEAYRPLFAMKLKRASAIFTCTAANVRCLSQAFPDTAPQLSYHGIAKSLFTADVVAMGEERLRLVTVGRLVDYKGFGDVPELAQRLVERGVDFTWELIGEGSLRSYLETEITRRELTGRVVLKGPMPNTDVLERVRQSDIFVFLGKQDRGQYGLPNVLIEAAASGTCIVSRHLDTLEELVEPSVTGFVADELDAFAATIEHLSKDREHLVSVAANARARVTDCHCHEANFSQLVGTIHRSIVGEVCQDTKLRVSA